VDLDKLITGVHGLDKLLRGGFPLGKTSLVYGEASTGKTVLAMQTALQASARGFKVFFIDCDLSFSVQRLESLDRGRELAENVVLFQPEDFREQTRILEGLEVLLSKTPALLIIDSITGLYRAELEKPGAAFGRSRELNRQLAYLSDLSSRISLTVLLTGQVHSQPGFGTWVIAPVAMRTLRHWSFLILRLRPTPRQDARECLLEKIDGREVKGPRTIFRIGENGLSDV
jgi:DNA repair protein RadB